jgi:hypothetical protein
VLNLFQKLLYEATEKKVAGKAKTPPAGTLKIRAIKNHPDKQIQNQSVPLYKGCSSINL